MDELSAALAYSQLQRVGENHKRLGDVANAYRTSFEKIPAIILPPTHPHHAWHLFVIAVPTGIRDQFRINLKSKGIGTQIHYRPLHRQPYIEEVSAESKQQEFPHADLFYKSAVSIPMFAGLTDNGVKQVIISVKSVINDLG